MVLDSGSLGVHHTEVLNHPWDGDTQVTSLSSLQHTPQNVEQLHLQRVIFPPLLTTAIVAMVPIVIVTEFSFILLVHSLINRYLFSCGEQ